MTKDYKSNSGESRLDKLKRSQNVQAEGMAEERPGCAVKDLEWVRDARWRKVRGRQAPEPEAEPEAFLGALASFLRVYTAARGLAGLGSHLREAHWGPLLCHAAELSLHHVSSLAWGLG